MSFSRVGLWDESYKNLVKREMYYDPTTGKIAGAYLNRPEIQNVEDWGCGKGGFKDYIGDHQEYIGVDGSRTPYADVLVDLEFYFSDVDAIHMRHIIEHNPRWDKILHNAINSFRKRMVLTIFTSFRDSTQVIAEYPNFNNSGVTMVDIAFRKEDIISAFRGVSWFSIENIKTETQYGVEQMFFLEKGKVKRRILSFLARK